MPSESEARRLVEENASHNPELVRALWFPHDVEYRLIYVDPTVIPAEGRVPIFEFHLEDRKDSPLLVGVIRPEEVDHLELPGDWGNWRDAREIFRAA